MSLSMSLLLKVLGILEIVLGAVSYDPGTAVGEAFYGYGFILIAFGLVMVGIGLVLEAIEKLNKKR